MKLTQREKVLLAILLSVLILYVEYTYLLKGMLDRSVLLSSTKGQLEQRLSMAQNAAEMEKTLNEKLEKSRTTAFTVMDKYFVSSEQEELILLAHDLLDNSGVDASGFTFAAPEDAQVGDATFRKITMTMNFTASYGAIEKWLKKVWDFQKMIAVDNVSISRNEQGTLNGTVDLCFYYLSGHEGLEYRDNLYQITPEGTFYKEDPFVASAGANDFRINYTYTGGEEPGESPYVPYADLTGHWAETIINDFGNQGFLPPVQATVFGPDTAMTRGEFVIMLDRIYKWPIPAIPVDLKQFSDYNTLGSYENAIAKAVTKGYLGGYVVGFSDNTLRPRDPMTYEEMEFIIQKLKGKSEFKWESVASQLKAEKGIDSPGINNRKAFMSKAEAVYLMSVVK